MTYQDYFYLADALNLEADAARLRIRVAEDKYTGTRQGTLEADENWKQVRAAIDYQREVKEKVLRAYGVAEKMKTKINRKRKVPVV